MRSYKAYKFRLYPSEKQTILIHKTFGCVRFVYNHYLAKQEKEEIKKAFKILARRENFLKRSR